MCDSEALGRGAVGTREKQREPDVEFPLATHGGRQKSNHFGIAV
jgi:hypothetical protein